MLALPMKQMGKVRERTVAGLATAFCAAAIACLLHSIPEGSWFTKSSYDMLHRLCVRAAALTNSPVMVVYLDLESYLHERQDPADRWPRDLHAQLVRRLSAAGARAIVFDILFSGAADERSDAALAE